MAELIQFETGLKTFSLNEACEVTFNPYDFAFLGRITDAAEKLDKIQGDLQTAGEDWAIIYAKSKESDRKMREIIDGLFGQPVCDAVFPGMFVFAIGDGLPVWANLLLAIVEKMDAGMEDEKGRAQKRIRKYSEKYKK